MSVIVRANRLKTQTPANFFIPNFGQKAGWKTVSA